MAILGALPPPENLGSLDAALAARGTGIWECNLADNRLCWTSGIYDIFGIERGAGLDRDYTASLYVDRSRRAMEQLRQHSIRFKRGFTMDAHIRQPGGEERWMRLSTMPIIENRRVTRLRGLKVNVTAQYDLPDRRDGTR